MKKSMLIGGSIFCMLLICCISYQPVLADDNDNPRYHYDVKIVLISKVFDTITIDGFHNQHEGWGYDNSIELEEANWIRLFGFLQIYNDSMTLEKNYHGGWIHTNIEITGFSGWMMNQHSNPHVIMIGTCDIVKLTAGRG